MTVAQASINTDLLHYGFYRNGSSDRRYGGLFCKQVFIYGVRKEEHIWKESPVSEYRRCKE